MTETEANVLLKINEDKYFNLGEGKNVIYIAVVKKSNDITIKNDYYIEIGLNNSFIKIGLDDFIFQTIEKRKLQLDNVFGSEISKEYINEIINIVETGKVKLQSSSAHTIRLKKITGGVSIFFEESMGGSGTAGAFFKMKNNNDIYLLSNYHVVIDENYGSGSKVVHPSHADASINHIDDLVIGTVYWKCLNSILDAAIVKIDYPVAIGKYTIDNKLIFDGITLPKIGENVKKCGRTTGVTFGEIRSINCTVNASGNNKKLHFFRNQILTTCMSKDGDSGSVLVNNNNQVVGLIFAGDDEKTTFSNNIMNIFNSNIKNEPIINFSKFV